MTTPVRNLSEFTMDHLPARDRIVLEAAEDLPDVVHQAVAAIAQGESVYLDSTSFTGLLTSGLARPHGPTLHSDSLTILLKDPEELPDWVPDVSPLGVRIARKAWPGRLALTFLAPSIGSLLHHLPFHRQADDAPVPTLTFLVPSDPFLQKVLGLLPGPVLLEPDPAVPRPIALHIEAETRPELQPNTLVHVDDLAYRIIHQGDVPEPTVRRMACTVILFICTGNTCRSPMAEAIAKILLAEKLGCEIHNLESLGYHVHSAGITASDGQPAASHAVDTVKRRGGDLQPHRSRRLTLDHVRQADVILPMTQDHLEALLHHAPDAALRTRLLHPEGLDLADPYGSDRANYLDTAQLIESCLARHLASILANSR